MKIVEHGSWLTAEPGVTVVRGRVAIVVELEVVDGEPILHLGSAYVYHAYPGPAGPVVVSRPIDDRSNPDWPHPKRTG